MVFFQSKIVCEEERDGALKLNVLKFGPPVANSKSGHDYSAFIIK
jgi:hypothetical protein